MAAALNTAAKREGHKAMEKTLSAAAAARRPFKAGPPRRKDLALTPARAVVEAWALLDELQTGMRHLGLQETDVQAALVLLTGDLSDERQEKIYAYPVPNMAGLPALYEKVKNLPDNTVPLGVVFKQYDYEAEAPEIPAVWVEPWRVFQNANRALLSVAHCFADLRPGEEILFSQSK